MNSCSIFSYDAEIKGNKKYYYFNVLDMVTVWRSSEYINENLNETIALQDEAEAKKMLALEIKELIKSKEAGIKELKKEIYKIKKYTQNKNNTNINDLVKERDIQQREALKLREELKKVRDSEIDAIERANKAIKENEELKTNELERSLRIPKKILKNLGSSSKKKN